MRELNKDRPPAAEPAGGCNEPLRARAAAPIDLQPLGGNCSGMKPDFFVDDFTRCEAVVGVVKAWKKAYLGAAACDPGSPPPATAGLYIY